MMLMDRFVTTLKGDEVEVVSRDSKDSAVTMKEHGMTINRQYNQLPALINYISTLNFDFKKASAVQSWTFFNRLVVHISKATIKIRF